MDHKLSKNSLIVVDQSPNRLSFRVSPDAHSHPPLALSAARKWQAPKRATACILSGDPASNLASAFSAAAPDVNWDKARVLFGVDADPFADGLAGLSTALRCIEVIASRRPARFTIQTRSSLLLFALPVLRSLPNADAVISLETIDEQIHSRLLSHQPRPTERFELIRTLKKTGFGVSLRVTPIIFQRESGPAIEKFADAIRETGCELSYQPIDQLLPVQPEREIAPLMRARRLLVPNAERLVRNSLIVKADTPEVLQAVG